MTEIESGSTKFLDEEMQEVKNVITEMVNPKNRPNININPDHILVLHGTKSKKQFKSKIKPSKQKKTLTRKESIKLGLNHIATKSMKYQDVVPLHNLWKGYIKEHLSLYSDTKIPTVSEPGYDNFSKLLVKSDLHGAKVSITKSKCPSFVGISGIIILETKNTLKIICKDNKIRTVPKPDCIFTLVLGNLTFTIVGKHLTMRPAERSVKKIKNFMDFNL